MKPIRHVLLPLALAACAACAASPDAAVEPERVVEPRPVTAAAPRGTAALRDAMLRVQNAARADVGVAPLAWDEALVDAARSYAETMARSGRFEHAAQPAGGPARQGENLFTGTRGAYSYAEMAQLWVDERRDFVNRPTPQFSRSGRWEDVAHYTQIVWRGSTRVGCALAASRGDDYLVCRYAPAGNVVGERAF